ncbi:histone acetyltransferases subunit 3-domain-containing protein [Phycomyces nitens]|nr:histone acetyltransferases subunit 3-domain-containing protein [Phycomyces nitens]
MNKNHEAATQDTDFIRVKPKDQVPILTFWQAVEPYFRPLAEADREFLLEKGDDTTPYSIPSLGQYYADVWAEGDISVGNRPHSPYTRRDPSGSNLKYLAPHRPLTEDCLMNNNLSCGRLTERLLSSLVKEDPLSEKELEELKADEARDWLPLDHDTEKTQLLTYPPEQVAVFEERLKRELRYAGLFNEEDTDWYAREDDQLCAELRQLGRELKEQAKINEFRKKRLLQVVDQQLQYEQYRQVLDTLDNQVDQCYMKRFRTQKSKKRKAGSTPKSTLSENAVYAMEKRRKWTTALGPIFNKKNCVMPTVSIYEDQSEDGLTNGQT